MSLKISEYTVEQTTLQDGDKQELSTETAPGVWETRWYSITNLYAKIKLMIFGDFIETTLGTTDTKVPTSKAVSDAIAAASGAVDSVNGQTGVVVLTATDVDALKRDGSNANSDVDLGTYALNAKSVKVNGTGGAGHLSLKHQSSYATAAASESAIYADSSGNPKWKNDSLTLRGIQLDNSADTSTNYTTPLDSDKMSIWDVANSVLKSVTWANVKATLKTYFDTLYLTAANNLSDLTNSTTARANLGLDNRLAVLAETATDGALASGTAITYSTGVLITPSMIDADTSIEIITGIKKTTNNGTVVIYLYANTTNDTSGSPILISSYTTGAVGVYTIANSIFLRIKTKNNSTEVRPTSQNNNTDIVQSIAVVSSLSIDWTSNKYIVAAVKCNNSLDASSTRITFLKVRR